MPKPHTPIVAALKRRLAKTPSQSARQVSLLRRAAELGDVDALEELAMYFRDGLKSRRGRMLVRRDEQASIRCYRRAAELGSARAMDALATSLSGRWERTGRRASALEVAEAVKWYRKAIRLGGDCYNLAVTYQNLGQHKSAVYWFRKSAAAGDVSALLPLAKAELYGVGVRRNVSAALAKFRRVADEDVKVCQFDREEAMRNIAQALYDGWLVHRDYEGVIVWLRRAAKLGSAAAEGLLRDHGESG